MLSVRVDDDLADGVRQWADHLGVDRSELLRDAVRKHLARLAAEQDIAAWSALPLTDDEAALAAVADWGPAEEWSDWADAAG